MQNKQNFTTWLDENFPTNSGATTLYITLKSYPKSLDQVREINRLTALYSNV